jgi:hypothetical protein
MAAKWTKTIVGVTLMTGIAGSAGALDLFARADPVIPF